MVFAVASARIEVTETLDGSLIEMIDDVLAPNPFRGIAIVSEMIKY